MFLSDYYHLDSKQGNNLFYLGASRSELVCKHNVNFFREKYIFCTEKIRVVLKTAICFGNGSTSIHFSSFVHGHSDFPILIFKIILLVDEKYWKNIYIDQEVLVLFYFIQQKCMPSTKLRG
jgi:hypothetical protein